MIINFLIKLFGVFLLGAAFGLTLQNIFLLLIAVIFLDVKLTINANENYF